MKERILQLLDLEQLTPSKFADIIGVQRSSVSHVISGRNNPSFDFIQKTLKAFPGLNAEWLILGKGTMYEQMGRRGTGTLFDEGRGEGTSTRTEMDASVEELENQDETKAGVAFEKNKSQVEARRLSEAEEGTTDLQVEQSGTEGPGLSAVASVSGKPGKSVKERPDLTEEAARKRISRVILLYEDDTFTSFDPS